MHQPKRLLKLLAVLSILAMPSLAAAKGWCSFAAGEYSVTTHGTKTDKVWLTGTFVGTTVAIWVPIQDSAYGKAVWLLRWQQSWPEKEYLFIWMGKRILARTM